jgi:hypothetical protein
MFCGAGRGGAIPIVAAGDDGLAIQATLPPSHPHVERAQQLVLHVEDEAARRA